MATINMADVPVPTCSFNPLVLTPSQASSTKMKVVIGQAAKAAGATVVSKGRVAPIITTSIAELTPESSPVETPNETAACSPVEEHHNDDGKCSFDLEEPLPAPAQIPAYPELIRASTRLQRMIKEDRLIVCPGVYDGLSARTAHEVGFDCLYMTGAGTSCSRLGVADLGLATLADMRANAEMICSLDPYGAPVIADIDGGYGGPMMVARSVEEYIRAGVAGFHIEDQLIQKRCGHLAGKKVVSREEFYSRIRAAQATRARLGSDIVLIARTDALQTLGYDECVARLKGARALGADVGLLEGFATKQQAKACAAVFRELGWPLLMNSVENGASPLITVQEAREWGFRLMIFSFASIAPAYVAIKQTLRNLKETGVLGTDKSITPKRLFQVCGMQDLVDIDNISGGGAFKEGV